MCRAASLDVIKKAFRQAPNRCNVHARVGQFQIRNRSLGGFPTVQGIAQPRHQQTVGYRNQTLRALRMAFTHLVLVAIGVAKVAGLLHLQST